MKRRLLLAGAGHAHAQVLKNWQPQAWPDVELVVVSPYALAPYSGMVPGWLAGTYDFADIAIDFEALCQQAGARWLPAAIDKLDPDGQRVDLDNGASLTYDWLSLNIGSTLTAPVLEPPTRVLSMRPLSALQASYEQLLQHWQSDPSSSAFHVQAVGGGAAGLESLLAVLRRLRRLRPERNVRATLMSQSLQLLPGYPGAARRKAQRALQAAGVDLQLGVAWQAAHAQDADLLLWATGAQAHAWQRCAAQRGSLSVSAAGFVEVDPTLRARSHANIFAVGDCAEFQPSLPKAGVYAVRMGPVLAHNLAALIRGRALHNYVPQKNFLSLLSTADGSAIASRGPFCLSGPWAWRLKHHIDRGFVQRFSPGQA